MDAPNLISFSAAPAVAELVDATSRLAEGLLLIEETALSHVAALQDGVRRVRDLGVSEMLLDQSDISSGSSILFHIADALGSANLTVAWQGLLDVPPNVARLMSGGDFGIAYTPLAVPSYGSHADWSALSPLLPVQGDAQCCILTGSMLIGPVKTSISRSCTRLPGFPHGAICEISLLDGHNWPSFTLAPNAVHPVVDLSIAMAAGLLNGALRRIVTEAYLYAKSRKSSGKFLNQHQAVMLRLADLALYQQGVELYLHAAVERQENADCGAVIRSINIDFVTECAMKISQDALQVAAGHGYVEGLPFKKLFEQIRTLTSFLALMSRAASHEHCNFA